MVVFSFHKIYAFSRFFPLHFLLSIDIMCMNFEKPGMLKTITGTVYLQKFECFAY
jgi:hypothetical protein